MADEADVGNEAAESHRGYRESEIRRLANILEAVSTGNCLSSGCGLPLPPVDVYFCSSDCREIFKKKKKGMPKEPMGACCNNGCTKKVSTVVPRWCSKECCEDWEIERKKAA